MKIIKLVSTVLFLAMLTACLKSTDNNFVNSGISGSANSVSFVNVTGTGPYGYSINSDSVQNVNIQIANQSEIFTFYVKLNSADNSYPSTSVTIDTPALSLVSLYNHNKALDPVYDSAGGDTSYQILPDSVFKWQNLTATVDPKTHLAAFNLQILSNKVDLNTALDPTLGYALGIKIKSVSNPKVTISHNLVTKILTITPLNAYDGIYSCKGYTYRSGDPVKTGNFPLYDVPLVTNSVNQNQFGVLQIWADSTGVGIGYPVLTINPDNSVTVTSVGANLATPVANAPGYNSRYDPASKTFYISYNWNSGRLVTDTMVYIRPR